MKRKRRDEIKIGEPLTLTQFAEILKFIQNNFEDSWPLNKQCIKYVYPALDLRDNKIFWIRFRAGKTHIFDFRDSAEPMFDRIMNWLKEDDKS